MIVREHVKAGRVGEPFAWATLTMSGLDELIAGTAMMRVCRDDDRLVVELERLS
jgi:hypothetical protein